MSSAFRREMAINTVTMSHKELHRLQIIQESIMDILLRNKLRHAAFLFGRLNVWCNGIEMKGLLVWFPTDVESVLIIPFLLNSEQQ
jgi:hypothetical protein